MALPEDCIAALKEAHAREGSFAKAGALIGYSAAAVCQLLSGAYKAKDTSKVEAAIRAQLLRETVDCPELSEIPMSKCFEWRKRARDGQPSTPFGVVMLRRCGACRRGRPNGGG
jgi:hypothetical protein